MSRSRLIGLLLVLLTVLAYLPALRNGFVNFDDPDYVTENSMVQQGLTGGGIRWAFHTWHASNWHPLTWLSHMSDCELFRLNPAGHHLVSLLFHAANTWLLFILWLRLTGSLWPSALVAALFAWHPLHVESVAWVSERKDVLSTFFALLALLSYAEYAGARRGPLRHGFYWLAAALFALALMAKPMFVTLPFVMLLLDYWPLQRLAGAEKDGQRDAPGTSLPVLARRLLEKWPFFLLTAASCVVTILAQRSVAIASLKNVPLDLRLENVLTAYAAYLGKTFWPAKLAVFYPLLPPGLPEILLAAALLAAISFLAWRTARSWPCLAVGWLWFLGTLVPVIGLVQVGSQALADRYTYFPLIGIFVAVIFGISKWAQRARWPLRWLPAGAALLLAGCLLATGRQLQHWRSGETLFEHALAVTPDNGTARLNLGAACQEQKRPAEALANYKRALELEPANPEAYNNVGRLLNDQGKPAEALDYCRTAVTLNPRNSKSHNSLGVVLAELGRYDDALSQFAESERLDPDYAAPHFQSGRALLKLGRPAEALRQFQAALRMDPSDVSMLIYIARVLAADPDPVMRNGAASLALAQHAAQLAGPQQPVVLDTLAMACAEAGHFDDATNLGRQAVALALANGAPDDATNMQQRLELYLKHQPARLSAP